MEYVLQTFGLSKRYKKQWALRKVDMNIARGDIYGFVGENGSGKTTIIRLITGLISATEGGFELFGASNQSAEISLMRKKMGAVVETPSIHLNMSAADNLKLQGLLLGVRDQEKMQEVLQEVGLSELWNDSKRAGDYSLGMRQRLGIAMALLGDPEFLVLDEPMNGLDPAGIVEIRELILKLNYERKITFLISSHILTELSLVATKYGIISKGKIVKEITAEDLRRECRPTVFINTPSRDDLMAFMNQNYAESDYAPTARGCRIFGEINLTELLKGILDAGIVLESVNCHDSSIEEYYLSLIGGARHD